ncbi:prephenate dehydratase [Shewanella intestini]|uniref:Prephenate dehydratase n=1 Tax=Shewanella intestini TaxID=2017544 RepID=A0ABS5HYF6_9GAMM|nr:MULTISPECIES: prephenate dehydratase [Shewanella]MBR9726666.1 prephenate dehydratase [Shewanella intestini]MRG34768.1 prephenate dehydratase [Shewanella sp. XMDDZSB0408]
MQKPPTLDHTRQQITHLDKELLGLLAKRRALSLDVARSKEVDIRPIRDTQREKELLERLVQQGREQGLDAHYVISLYQSIIEDSVLNQQAYLQTKANIHTQQAQYSVAYLGARGSYSYLAANRYCDRRQVEMVDFGCQSFNDIIHAVESGHADYGFLPIENTSSGSINEVYDVLQHTSLSIVGETTIEVGHCLLAAAGSDINKITKIYAHPQPISQCSRYLSQHSDIKLEYCSSSAEAMDKVLNSKSQAVAAIGSAEGGALYNLTAIDNDLANQKINQSRFIVVARKAVEVPSQLPAKTTLIMATGHKPGALVEALLVLKTHNVNMSKLESRPIAGTPWEEMFYLDIDGNLANENVQKAINELEKQTRFIKVLGCYPCETVKPTQLSQSQLFIEPDSSKAVDSPSLVTQTPSQSSQHAKHRREFKAQNSIMHLHNMTMGGQAFNAIKQVALTDSVTEIAAIAKHAKESGFEALVLTNSNLLINEQLVKEAVKAINAAGLGSCLTVEHIIELNIAAKLADGLIINGSAMFDDNLLHQAGGLSLPVLIERHVNATTEQWMAAAETILSTGNQQVGLIDAGIKSLNEGQQLSLDIAGLIDVKQRCHLPVIVNLTRTATETSLPQQAIVIKQLALSGIIIDTQEETQTDILQRVLFQ